MGQAGRGGGAWRRASQTPMVVGDTHTSCQPVLHLPQQSDSLQPLDTESPRAALLTLQPLLGFSPSSSLHSSLWPTTLQSLCCFRSSESLHIPIPLFPRSRSHAVLPWSFPWVSPLWPPEPLTMAESLILPQSPAPACHTHSGMKGHGQVRPPGTGRERGFQGSLLKKGHGGGEDACREPRAGQWDGRMTEPGQDWSVDHGCGGTHWRRLKGGGPDVHFGWLIQDDLRGLREVGSSGREQHSNAGQE